MFAKLRGIPDGSGFVALNDEPDILSHILEKKYTSLMKCKWKFYSCPWHGLSTSILFMIAT